MVLLSTSGRSPQPADRRGAPPAECGAEAWALTGPGPNPLAAACADAVCLPGDTATVQETHLAALHMLCRAVESRSRSAARLPPWSRWAAPSRPALPAPAAPMRRSS